MSVVFSSTVQVLSYLTMCLNIADKFPILDGKLKHWSSLPETIGLGDLLMDHLRCPILRYRKLSTS